MVLTAHRQPSIGWGLVPHAARSVAGEFVDARTKTTTNEELNAFNK